MILDGCKAAHTALEDESVLLRTMRRKPNNVFTKKFGEGFSTACGSSSHTQLFKKDRLVTVIYSGPTPLVYTRIAGLEILITNV